MKSEVVEAIRMLAKEKENMGNRKRNNGSCANEVALASGVWLEIVDESTENQEKDGGRHEIRRADLQTEPEEKKT